MTSRGAAIRYARALFDVAQKEADIQHVGRELSEFTRIVSSHDGLTKALSNPAIPAQRKRAVMEQLLARAGAMTPTLSKLLLLLAERTSAVPLGAERVAALQQGLQRVTGRQVQLETRVDPTIIGGAVARIGSTVYDGSVTTQLHKVQERLTAAAAE